MPLTQQYSFDDAANFNLTNAVISSNVGKLGLIENPGQNFTQTFDNDLGFTYDNTKAEFISGVVRKKDQTPANSIIAAIFNATTSANWNKNGSLVPVLNGTPTITSNKLQCFGSNGLSYSVVNSGVGAIKFEYKPNYTGSPSTNRNMVAMGNTATSNSYIQLSHSPSGDNFRILLKDSFGVSIISTARIGASNVNLSSATTYEIELNWSNITGNVRLFINGNLHGTLTVAPWSHGTGAASLYIGASPVVYNTSNASFSNPVVYNTSNASFSNVIFFNSVQHTNSYTPGYTVPNYIYAKSKVDLPLFPYTGIGTIQAIESSAVIESGTPRYTVAGLWWNGLAWVVSTIPYVEANDSATTISKLPNLAVTGAPAIPVSVHFDDSNSQSSVDSILVTVTGQKYSPTGLIEPAQGLQVKNIVNYFEGNENVVGDGSTVPVGTSIGRVLKVDGVYKYWNDLDWVTSDLSEGQTNSEAEIKNNVSALSLGKNSTIYPCWVLFTTLNTVTPEIDLASLSYNFGLIETDLAKCRVSGFLKDISGNPIEGAKLRFQISLATKNKDFYKEAGNSIMSTDYIEVLTGTQDSQDLSPGEFAIDLVRSSQYEFETEYRVSINTGGTFWITKGDNGLLTFQVPDAEFKDITDLLPNVA